MSTTMTMYSSDSRSRRRIPLKHSLLFSKAKHSEDWHQAIDAIAGVLHPSDPKFPYSLLRQTTEVYLKKKGKITQADTDIRLAILIDAHQAKDVAVAAAAYATSASSLRATLHVDLNVAHGSYWGLDTWLQCLIAANYGNPASCTDLEATWAQHLLPFATHGSEAAVKVLIGVSRALRECPMPNMNAVPDFLSLTSRALADYATHLEGLRLRNHWVAAHGASYWMAELTRTSPATTHSCRLLPEHIFDAHFPIWRVWARWRPDLRRITLLSSMDNNSAGMISDLLALEGPDFITGTRSTLRDGLIEQYEAKRSWLKLGSMVIEVLDCNKDNLRILLESAASTLETLWTAASKDRLDILRLFTGVTVNRPLTQKALNLVQSVLYMQDGVSSDVLSTVVRVFTEPEELKGDHVLELQNLIQLLDHDRASGLRRLLLTPATLQGIVKCLQDCQYAVRTLIEKLQPWTELALELHAFCNVIKSSRSVTVAGDENISKVCLLLPSAEHIAVAIDIYTFSRRFRGEPTANERKDPASDQRVSAPSYLTGQSQRLHHPLEKVVEEYCLHRLLAQDAASHASQRIFDSISRVWKTTHNSKSGQSSRALAVLIAGMTSDNIDLSIRCLNAIAVMNDELVPGLSVQVVQVVLQGFDANPDSTIVKLVRLLANCPTTRDHEVKSACWRDLTYHLIAQETQHSIFKKRDLVKHTLSTMKATEWMSFLKDVETLFTPGPSLSSEEDSTPLVLHPDLQRWSSQLSPYTKTLERLESASITKSEAVRCMLSREGIRSENTLAILETLKLAVGTSVEPFLHKIVGLLSTKANNEWAVSDCIAIMAGANLRTVEACKKVWDTKHGYLNLPGLPSHDALSVSQIVGKGKSVNIKTPSGIQLETPVVNSTTTSRYNVPPSVVEIMVAGWLLDEKTEEATKNAIRSMACLLDILQSGFDISKEKLSEVADFWQKIEEELIEEAQKLIVLQKALKAKDPEGTSLLLQQIGIHDTTDLEEEMMSLPAGVLDLVEIISNNEFEISFSLAALNQLQRSAMGVPDTANTLLFRLYRDSSKKSPPSFCLHYDIESTSVHSLYSCSATSENPTKQICTSVQTALTWQLNRIVYSQLRRGEVKIADVYQNITSWLRNASQFCVSCSTSHDAQMAQLCRSTPCDLLSCARLWYNIPLHVRIPEIRTDTFAVDIALSSIYTAAMTGKSELLLSCPIRANTAAGQSTLVRLILDSLPSMAVMRDAVHLSSVLSKYHALAETLISWAVVHHRGFLATATGLLKIPNLAPGTHQFVLANASSKLEKKFATSLQSHNLESTALFHGTSLDRLPAILAQGLRVFSGTPLQRTGAAHGKGIYLSEDPATSLYYSQASLSWKNSGLTNMKLLLGCEVAGFGNKVSGNIHLIPDAERVMVRYVLLFTREARIPIRGHIEPAMASGMKALRKGTV